jgi:Trk K+ transport system NAD-binding subunit
MDFGGRQTSDGYRRRIGTFAVGLVGVVVLYVVTYRAGMAAFEGRSVTLGQALLAVVESMTTTGFGEAADQWTSWQMQVMMVVVQLTGVAFVFLTLPLLVAPWVEDRFATAAPTSVEESGHVVVCGFTSRGEELIDQLLAHEESYAVVEPDRERASELLAEGVEAVHADPETEDGLRAANLPEARALVADAGDEVNASVALTARSVEGDLPVATFAEEPGVEEYHRLAGASKVFSPRQLIGRSLARKVTAGVTRELDDVVEIAEDFDIAEFPVQPGSELDGETVADSGIRERTGVDVIGMWSEGKFLTPPPPGAAIDGRAVLVVAGHESGLQQLKGLTRSARRRRTSDRVVVAGLGEVGMTVLSELREAGLDVVGIDREDGPAVDVVGDATERETWREADVDDAGTVILALGDDTDQVFATLVVRELAPDLEVVARADTTDAVGKLYRAGADYVLALSTVSGRMLAAELLEEEVISFDNQVELVRIDCGALAGRSVADADVRARTGVTVIAIERDGAVITDFDADFTLAEGDDLVVAGTDGAIDRFYEFVA